MTDFSFCEPSIAGSLAPWCIRQLNGGMKKLGGGITTPSLCGRVSPTAGGWDLATVVSRSILTTKDSRTPGGYVVCRRCCELLYAIVGELGS